MAVLIVVLVVAAAAGSGLAGWWYARESPPHQGPIVLISVDGLRAERVQPPDPASRAPLPSIGALAADAVVFDRAYTHSPLTLPAHASMLAGQLPVDHGVRDEAGFVLKDDVRSLAELLRNRGFETGAAVSSILLRRESGVAQGFTFFDADLAEQSDELGPVIERDATLTAEAAERWMESRRDRRFFLFVQVGDGEADAAVAQIVEHLKALDLYQEATIVLTSDAGDQGSVRLDESALHVPLIVKQPESQGAGRRVNAPVQHIDILPTVLDMVRAPVPSGLRGRSLRQVLDSDEASLAERPIYSESLAARFRLGSHGVFAMSRGPYRYIRGSRDEFVDLEAGTVTSPPPDIPAAAELRTALDQLLQGRTINAPRGLGQADEDVYAAAGYLGGGNIEAAAPALLDPDEEAELLEGHRSAAALAGQKKYTEAIDQLARIARVHPQLPAVQFQLATLLQRTGRFEEATTAFRALRIALPDNPYIATAAAESALRARELADARELAALAVRLAESRDAAARGAAREIAMRVALADKDVKEALAHAEAVEKEDPGRPLSQFVRARIAYDGGNYEAALGELQRAEAVLEQHGGALEELHWYLGDTLARLDRFADAETHFREEMRLFPRNMRTYASLAMLYRASNRDQSIVDVLTALIETAPTPEGYATAARLWTVLGERERAAALRTEARTRFRRDPSFALFR